MWRSIMAINVGIDLGTTFSVVAIIDEITGEPKIIADTQGNRVTPSVIQFEYEMNEVKYTVGSEAKEAMDMGESGCVSTFKRRMGNPEKYFTFKSKSYNAEDLSALLLEHIKKQIEEVTEEEIDSAVITVPAYFFDKERRATMNAARNAGLNVKQVIN